MGAAGGPCRSLKVGGVFHRKLSCWQRYGKNWGGFLTSSSPFRYIPQRPQHQGTQKTASSKVYCRKGFPMHSYGGPRGILHEIFVKTLKLQTSCRCICRRRWPLWEFSYGTTWPGLHGNFLMALRGLDFMGIFLEQTALTTLRDPTFMGIFLRHYVAWTSWEFSYCKQLLRGSGFRLKNNRE